MREQRIDALYLDTTVNLNYFTGLDLKLTERLHGAILPADGPLTYLSPAFEEPKTRSMLKIDSDIRIWEEHEDPGALVIDTIESLGIPNGRLANDPNTPFSNIDGLPREPLRAAERRHDHRRLPGGEDNARDRSSPAL